MKTVHDFFEAWGEADAEARNDKIAGTMSDEFFYVDPRAPDPITELSVLQGYIGNFSKAAPGAVAKLAKLSTSHDLYHRATVLFMITEEMTQNGQYYVETDMFGRITKLVGFSGTGEPQ